MKYLPPVGPNYSQNKKCFEVLEMLLIRYLKDNDSILMSKIIMKYLPPVRPTHFQN